MASADEEFIKRLRATFNAEAEEHLQTIASNLLALEKLASFDDAMPTIESIYREAHSLKGAARAVDLPDVESLCQAMESVFSSWKRKETTPSAPAFDVLHKACDAIRAMVQSAHGTMAQHDRDELLRQLGTLNSPASSAGVATEITPAPRKVSDAASATAVKPAQQKTKAPAPAPAVAPAQSEKPPTADTIRISLEKLDAQLLQAEEMLTVKSMTAQHVTQLQAIVAMFDQWRQEWNKVSVDVRDLGRLGEGKTTPSQQAPPATASAPLEDFLGWNLEYIRLLENRITSLITQNEQDHSTVVRRVDDLLENSKKLLMLPFATLAQGFPKIVRDLCRDQGKDAELVIKGGEVEIDKRILDEMKDALIHVLRNSVDHGIETPAVRQSQHKPPRATITMLVSPVNGNKVEIAVADDGAGIDVEKVKSSAVRQRIISESEAKSLSDIDAQALVFQSGVSSSAGVTTISGRGLGMAIVRGKVEKLGGNVSLQSRRNAGITLRMILPLTLATFRGVLLVAGGQTFVVPTMNVERILRVRQSEIQTVENRETILMSGVPLSLVRLGAVLKLPAGSAPADPSAPMPVIVLSVAGQRIAFVVEDVLREEEVLVKSFRPPLVRIQNVAGVTLLGSGLAVPVLNVADLMKSARLHGMPPSLTPAPRAQVKKRVLVVEDSITSRMLLKGILESAGYQVKTAFDGMDAFATLRENEFDLIVSDVEMPRMNGFDLTEKIRGDRRLSELPVVLVTALESREQRERGIDAGANAYVVKSRFDQATLLEVVRRLV